MPRSRYSHEPCHSREHVKLYRKGNLPLPTMFSFKMQVHSLISLFLLVMEDQLALLPIRISNYNLHSLRKPSSPSVTRWIKVLQCENLIWIIFLILMESNLRLTTVRIFIPRIRHAFAVGEQPDISSPPPIISGVSR